MPRTVEIPGGIAVLRDASSIRERHRRLITATAIAAQEVIERLPEDVKKAKTPEEQKAAMEAMAKLRLTRQEVHLLDEMQDAAMLAFVESWSRPEPFPTTIEDIQDLPPDLYDALAAATKDDAAKVAMASFSPDPGNKNSPTGPSSDSSGGLRDDPKTLSQTSSTDTAPSNGGGSSPA